MINDYLPSYAAKINTDAQLQHICVSNLYVRMSYFPKAGNKEETQKYTFDHTCLLSQGKVKITVEGKSRIFDAPHLIFIAKEKVHLIEVLQDRTIISDIHAIRNGERVEDIIDPNDEIIPAGGKGFDILINSELNRFITN